MRMKVSLLTRVREEICMEVRENVKYRRFCRSCGASNREETVSSVAMLGCGDTLNFTRVSRFDLLLFCACFARRYYCFITTSGGRPHVFFFRPNFPSLDSFCVRFGFCVYLGRLDVCNVLSLVERPDFPFQGASEDLDVSSEWR